VHHQVGVGNAAVDFHDAVNRQDVACGLTGELVGAVAGANGNGQCVNAGFCDKVFGLHRVSQHLLVAEFAFGTNAVFFTCIAGFQAAQATQFALD